VKATSEELELMVTGFLYGSLLTHQSFSSEFTVVPVRGKDGTFRNRITLDGELGDFEISVKHLREGIEESKLKEG
jgi:hypothetical protein